MRDLRVSSGVEICTGMALMAIPATVVWLLLGVEVSGLATLMTRLFGLALFCLGLACWPEADLVPMPTRRAMLIYNAAIAAILIYLTIVEGYLGLLLWPALTLHVLMAVLIALPQRRSAF